MVIAYIKSKQAGAMAPAAGSDSSAKK
jgi:hypothetical protein